MRDAENRGPGGLGRGVLGVTHPASDSRARNCRAIASHICTGWKRARSGQEEGTFTREAPDLSAAQFLGDVPAYQPRVVGFGC